MSTQTDETEILHLNERLLEYEEAGNAEQLAPLLATEFSILRSSGIRHDREQFLAAVAKNAGQGRKAEEPTVYLPQSIGQLNNILSFEKRRCVFHKLMVPNWPLQKAKI